ncbi:MAG: hypothetical protein ACYSU0_14085, partial [Planctomycetota bacterium]
MADEKKIRLRCPACNVLVRGSASAAGVEKQCPKCGGTVRFEAMPEAPAAPEGGEPAAVGAADRCPKCSAPVAPDAVICVNCGNHLRFGIDVRTVARAKSAGRFGLAVAAGAVAAL